MQNPFKRNKKDTFAQFWAKHGDGLLEAWLRAIEDGNGERFRHYVEGEYRYYCEMPHEGLEDDTEYELPYHGVLDNQSYAEKYIRIMRTKKS